MEILKALKLVSPDLYRDNKIRLFTYWLHSIKVSDVVPVACSAASDAGIRSIYVTNFRICMVLMLGLYLVSMLARYINIWTITSVVLSVMEKMVMPHCDLEYEENCKGLD
ncbi:hypothetical protein POM88_021954 [Heracleum sosnowskyi]|uniref:Uncharacterized protein n=1 Tax=Heracleum sosnowskyi TaxID=360622 RepID=A0AAD8IED6_9APIA|nr:hypothetical protein POM88_021954 [Heracleum sosnowskyi]